MGAEQRAVRMVAHGKVQGVFFRDSCRRQARAAGVRGWVRNRSDGTVEAVLCGAPDAVESVLSWARGGPPQAVVTDLRTEETEDPGSDDFEVR